MVRATKMPFCHDRAGFLPIITMIAKQQIRGHSLRPTAKAPRMRFWEVGANLGDCALWAAAVLSAWGEDQPSTLVELDITAFEPIPASASAMRRSARELSARTAIVAPKAHTIRISVREVALGDSVGTRVFGIPLHSAAETTANDCLRQYYSAAGDSCYNVEVPTATVDSVFIDGYGHTPFDVDVSDGSEDAMLSRIRGGRATSAMPRNSTSRSRGKQRIDNGPVDFMKIHVQGDEVAVLRGAKESLQQGLVCVVLLKVYSIQINTGDPVELAKEVLDLLDGYYTVLVSPAGEVEFSSVTVSDLAENIYAARNNGPLGHRPYPEPLDRMLVAWTLGRHCQESIAVAAVRSLYAGELIGVNPA
eukprot:TRINITY_DN17829_c1_g2_i1.p1 TRINITY_DN17829_c1_g2~~TRINITY_DN17829_c1_g2_i1.p1  ORF type:complete len:424 (-),score=53.60 TRINITY_DN17829_c1_g2_i1:96-1181(-)